MDVVCGRCRAEYEFDDALISERGTTVRCTNCGLQFKVFPPVGQRTPEVWRVIDPRDDRVEPQQYDSLRELQKAIVRGSVQSHHMLARGDEEPRRLQDIVELQPLLQQPRSEPPPPVEPGTQVGEVGSSAARAKPSGGKTVLGIPQRPDPRKGTVEERSSSPRDTESGQGGDDVVREGRAQGSKPKIRSVLSTATSTGGHEPGPESVRSERPSISPRQSLRSTLVGTPHDARGPAEPAPSSSAPPKQSTSSSAPPAQSRPSSVPAAPEERPSPHPHAVPPTLPPEAKKASRSVAAKSSPSSSSEPGVARPVDPEISDPGEHAGQMTPTPGPLRSYKSPDAEPVSSAAGVPVSQRARSGGIVLAVLLGGAAFLAFANRELISSYLSGTKAQPEQTAEAEGISSDVARRVDMMDAAWVASELLDAPPASLEGQLEPSQLAALLDEVPQQRTSDGWHAVNLLRMQGDLSAARKMAAQLPKGPQQAYALSLLDLAEERQDPPWPVILERLREASAGERGRFLARSVYVYALAASGDVARAKADFDALGQLKGAQKAPLYESLAVYLERMDEGEDAEEDEEPDEVAEAEIEEEAASEGALSDSEEDEPESNEAAGRDDEPSEPEGSPEPEAEPEPQPEPAPAKKVSDAIKSKVAQADAMWRSGNQKGAVAIYRQVVAEIGTSHFLGQRSAARIAQAEREGVGSQ